MKGDDGSAMYRVRDRGKERILEPGEAGLGVEGERGDIPNAYGFGKELKHQRVGGGRLRGCGVVGLWDLGVLQVLAQGQRDSRRTCVFWESSFGGWPGAFNTVAGLEGLAGDTSDQDLASFYVKFTYLLLSVPGPT